MQQGRKDDTGKLPMHLIPPEAHTALARVLQQGAERYGPHNWETGIKYSRLYDALERHLQAWRAGEDIDPDSGLPHLEHVFCNAMFLAVLHARSRVDCDDRYMPTAGGVPPVVK